MCLCGWLRLFAFNDDAEVDFEDTRTVAEALAKAKHG